MEGFFHWRIKVSYLWKKVNQKINLQQRPTTQTSLFLWTEFFHEKPVSKNTIFFKKMLVTDVVIGKYIEETQQVKLKPALVKKKSILAAQTFSSGEISTWERKSELSLLHLTSLLVLIYATTKYYQNISNH